MTAGPFWIYLAVSRLGAAAHRAAVHAFIAGAAADHDCAAIRAGRRILLVETRHAADGRHRRAAARRVRSDRNDFFQLGLFVGFLFDDADLLLGIAIEKLGSEPAEDIVHDRFGHRDVGILGET